MSFATKQQFVEAYKSRLVATYPWAKDDDKLHRFLLSCITTLDGGNSWDHGGTAVTAAWHDIGGKGKPTLKALRALL